MDPAQDSLANPFGMDESCENCAALCETRTQVVHGYGDASAEFAFVGEAPGAGADRTGVPFTGDPAGERVQAILGELGFSESPPDATEPDLDNVYLTHLTRCRHPERAATDEELRNCEAFLTAELRMINPEVIVPIGQRTLRALAFEYTTEKPDDLDIEEHRATAIRGRGFELLPMRNPDEQTDAERAEFVERFADLLGSDYRQTKGRRSR